MGLTNEESLFNFTKGLRTQRERANFASSIANIGERDEFGKDAHRLLCLGTMAVELPMPEDDQKKKPKRSFLPKGRQKEEKTGLMVEEEHRRNERKPSIAMVVQVLLVDLKMKTIFDLFKSEPLVLLLMF